MRKKEFLKDVSILSVTAFGGPNAHIAMMLDYLVEKKNYLTAEELVELNALCQFLPGPTSTQTITSIGYKIGGPGLAALTLLIWIIPAVILMSALSFGYAYVNSKGISLDFLKYVYPMAVGFIVVAAYKISRKTVFDLKTFLILIFSLAATLLVRQPWIFPVVLVIGGIITNFASKEEITQPEKKWRPNWIYLALFAIIFIASGVAGMLTNAKPVILFENFYRFGSLIFGGGQVLIPLMYEQLVDFHNWMTSEEFLTGYGIVQALPGPVFSFAAYSGGIAMQDEGWMHQMVGCAIGATGIFLPGLILIFFVYPLWQTLKQYSVVNRSIIGVNAAASGLVVAAAVILFMALGFSWINTIIIIAVTAILIFSRFPAPLLVVVFILLGLLF